MGINISVYKIHGVDEVSDTYPDCLYKYFKKDKHPQWDIIRHSGDRDFMNQDFFDGRPEGDDKDGSSFEEMYYRPNDFPRARKWIKENVVDVNQKRLLDMMDEMELDASLYFRVSH